MIESNVAAEPTSTAQVATDDTTLSKLHALIEVSRGKRTWPPESAKAAEEMMAAALLSPTSTQAELGNILSLAQDLPIPIVESLFEKHWQSLPADRKDQLVSELLKLTSEKSQTRQAAVADKVARTDRRSAAYILQGLISRGKKGKEEDFWPQLSKEKKELLRGRFGNKEWVYFDEPEEPLMRVLMAGFVEAMTEPDGGKAKKSQRPAYDFSRWALSNVKRISIDIADRELVTKKVKEIAKDFPQQWKTELAKLTAEVPSEMTRRLPSPSDVDQRGVSNLDNVAPDLDETRTTAQQVTTDALPDASTSEAPVPEAGTPDSAFEESFRSAVTALITRKQTEVKLRNSSVELLQNDVRYVTSEIELLEQMLQALENSEAGKDQLESELKQIRLKADGLRAAISRLEAELASTRKAQQTAEALSRSLAHEREEVQQALDEEKLAGASERRELEDEIERTAAVRLEGFKAQLARSLRPVFKNKRTTDDQEPSSRLSEFLRSWLGQVEAQLNQAGVDISKDA
ncbi:MAG: hypothetical protein JWM21_3883 [Acidobacteria bacterium]|nr:hypothetical protein [Acidobacteriota bacterium]